MAQTPVNSTEFNELSASAPDSGSKIFDMASSRELGIEVESQSHEDNQDTPVLPECEYASILNISNLSKPDIVSYPLFQVSLQALRNLILKAMRRKRLLNLVHRQKMLGKMMLKEIQNDSKIPDYVCQKIAEAMSLLKMDLNRKGSGKGPNIPATKKPNKKRCTFEAAKDSWDQGNEIINVEVGHIDNQPAHTESPPNFNETIHDEPPNTESPPYSSLSRKGEN
ncbi:hypothetical protein O181_097834 [Austropuccinia psidii MF-1]|uniref:Uncharacterized protein n=1 Tax=Austropuccinia psidii MF-1 TaxID=1389203 RepID=A0A9Q3J9N1_9BASI|nr:hypothetical protein [Austropuccinia psidii MF-1]